MSRYCVLGNATRENTMSQKRSLRTFEPRTEKLFVLLGGSFRIGSTGPWKTVYHIFTQYHEDPEDEIHLADASTILDATETMLTIARQRGEKTELMRPFIPCGACGATIGEANTQGEITRREHTKITCLEVRLMRTSMECEAWKKSALAYAKRA